MVILAQLLVDLIIFCTAFQVDNSFSRKIVMASINILKFGVSSPSDISPLNQLKAAGYSPDDTLAVIGKSEGTLPAPQLWTWSDRFFRQWVCQRLLPNPQFTRVGTPDPEIRSNCLLGRH